MQAIVPTLAAVMTALVWLYVIRRYDRLEPEPLKALLYIGFLGGLGAITPAALLNTFAALFSKVEVSSPGGSLTGTIVFYTFVGFNEEFWKALATVLLIKNHPDFNEPVDGMIYALTVCLGFAAFENVDYILSHGLGVIIGRFLLSVPAHLTFGAIWGYGIAKARFLVPGHRYAATLAPLVLVAGLAHTTFNLLLVTLGNRSLIFVVLLLGLLLVYARSKLRYLERQSPFREPGKCTVCGTINPRGSHFCQQCGADRRLDFYRVCRQCHTRFGKGASYCPECGTKVDR